MDSSTQNQNTENMTSNMENEKNATNILVKLDKLFDLVWIVLYQRPTSDSIEKFQGAYRGLQAMIVKEANKMNAIDAVEYQIASLKLLDSMYKELVDNGFKKKAEEQGLSNSEIKVILHEKILGEKEKKKQNVIDFEEMYSPSIIKTLDNGQKSIAFQLDEVPSKFEQQLGEKRIVITSIGRLKYTNAFGLQTYVNKYSLLIFLQENGEPKTVQRDIYGYIDYKMIEENSEYRKAIFKELLALENVNREGNEGYVGEISSKEKENQYKVYYSGEEYSAVRVYQEQMREKSHNTLEKSKMEKGVK